MGIEIEKMQMADEMFGSKATERNGNHKGRKVT